MVLHQARARSSWLAILLVPASAFGQSLDEKQAITRALDFISLASAGKNGRASDFKYGTVHVTPDRFTAWEGEGGPTHWKVEFDQGNGRYAHVRNDTGLITVAHGAYEPYTEQFVQERKLLPSDFEQLALRLHQAAGWTEPQLIHFEPLPTRDLREVSLMMTPAVSGVPYHWHSRITMSFDYASGQLIQAQWPRIANVGPPPSLEPSISREMAVDAAVSFLTDRREVNQGAVTFQQLCIWRVGDFGDYADLTPGDLALKSAGTGKLVYNVFITDGTHKDGQTLFYEVIVACEDGRIVTVRKDSASGGFGTKATIPAPFSWNVSGENVRLTQAGRLVYSGRGSVELVRMTDSRSLKGVSVCLRVGNVVCNSVFDRASGLLGVSSQGRVSWGRPDQALKVALLKLK